LALFFAKRPDSKYGFVATSSLSQVLISPIAVQKRAIDSALMDVHSNVSKAQKLYLPRKVVGWIFSKIHSLLTFDLK
jgi:hypothetical protein